MTFSHKVYDIFSRILNLGMNRLSTLPRGFGSFPVLEVLDLSYNNLNEECLPGNFWIMQTLRALYLRCIFLLVKPKSNYVDISNVMISSKSVVDSS